MDNNKENIEEQEEMPIEGVAVEHSDEAPMTEMVKKVGTITLLVTVILTLTAGGYFWFKWSAEEKSNNAAIALQRVMPYLEAEDYANALSGDKSKTGGEEVIGLERIVADFSGTAQSYTAALYIGDIYLSQDNIAKAKEYFQKALNSESKLILMGAYAGLGVCNEKEGNNKLAAESYEKAALQTEQSTLKSRYYLYAGLNYEQTGDNASAEKNFRLVLDENKFSEFAGMAKGGLTRLGTKID